MSNLSRCRSEGRRAARSIRYSSNFGNSYTPRPKKVKEPKSLLELTLVDNDTMLIMDIDDIIYEYSNLCGDNTVHTDKFYTARILCQRVGLIYSQKKKWFMILALNDNNCYVLFENKELQKLPGINATLLKHKKLEKSNRLMNSVYDEITDVTTNPIHLYRTSELFRK